MSMLLTQTLPQNGSVGSPLLFRSWPRATNWLKVAVTILTREAKILHEGVDCGLTAVDCGISVASGA